MKGFNSTLWPVCEKDIHESKNDLVQNIIKYSLLQYRLYCSSRIPTSEWTGKGFETLILVGTFRFNRKLRISSERQ